MTKIITIGSIKIGGGLPIRVQSMLKSKTTNTKKCIKEINDLLRAGCEIIRVAIPDKKSLDGFKQIRKKFPYVPLVADIHFDYKLAIESIILGADKIRINPGNIGDRKKISEIIKTAKKYKIPIRIGVNKGSLPKNFKLSKNSKLLSLTEVALFYIKEFEKHKFKNIVISVKSSDVLETIRAYRELSRKTNYPLHLGVTEAGTEIIGSIKSAVALGTLLGEGIGDTIRVSLTGSSFEEVRVAYEILRNLGLRKSGPEFISCPTCGRTEIDVIKIARQVEKKLKNLKEAVKIATMGCVVNGPGEAREADFALCGGKKYGLIYVHGRKVKKVKEKDIVREFIKIVKGAVKND